MSKKKNQKQRQRQKRLQQKRNKGPGKQQANKTRVERVAAREGAGSLEGMKRAPPPELVPALILAAGACVPVLTVRLYPAWPAWWHVAAFVAAAVISTLVARRAAKRRPPKWDPLLFFGVSAFAAAISWSGDAGEIWVVNSGDQSVRWSVDGGLESELPAGSRARLDLRRGDHKLRSKDQIVDFSLLRGERVAIAVGPRTCVSVAGVTKTEPIFRLPATAPGPDACQPRTRVEIAPEPDPEPPAEPELAEPLP